MRYCTLFIFLILLSFKVDAQLQRTETIYTTGTEFWLGMTEPYTMGTEDSLKVVITSQFNTNGTLSIPLLGYSQSFTVIANVATVIYVPTFLAVCLNSEIIENRGILVETDELCSVYMLNLHPASTDGSKVLPVQSLGTEYMAMSYYGYNYSEILIVGVHDDTEIEITPSAPTYGGLTGGSTFTITLDRGETYLVKVRKDATGSLIKSTAASGDCRPFAVFSGTDCPFVPGPCSACDILYDQMFPVELWDYDYNTIPFRLMDRTTYKVMAKENNTTVTVDGAFVANLNAGQIYEVNHDSIGRCISADKLINVTQFMEGIQCPGPGLTDTVGDPAMMTLNSPRDMIDKVTFAAITSDSIRYFSASILVETAFIASLELDGVPVNPSIFKPYTSCSQYSYGSIPISGGSHTLDGLGNGFIAYVYGYGHFESYAYSVGSGFERTLLETIDSVLCTLDTLQLAAPSVLYNSWWSTYTNPDDTIGLGLNINVIPDSNEIYILNGSTALTGCEETFLYSVEIPDTAINISINASNTSICQGEPIPLSVQVTPPSTVYTYDWTPTSGLDDPTSPTPIASPFATMTYNVLVSSLTGCTSGNASITLNATNGELFETQIVADTTAFCSGLTANFNVDVERKIFEDLFDNTINGALWTTTTGGVAANMCGVFNANVLFFDNGGVRSAETIDMNTTTGGSVRFSLKISDGTDGCDDAEFADDVILEYSNNAGGTWVPINTMLEFSCPVFTDFVIPIPVAAQTAATRFRWIQNNHDGVGTDNWSLENVIISVVNSAGLIYAWSPTTNMVGSGTLSPSVTPPSTVTYTLDITDPVTGCTYYDTVLMDVGTPFTLSTTPDQNICSVSGVSLTTTPSISDTIANYSYSWSPTIFINNYQLGSVIATPTFDTVFYVNVSNTQGCSAIDSVRITIDKPIQLDVSPEDFDACAIEDIDAVTVLNQFCSLAKYGCATTNEAVVTGGSPSGSTKSTPFAGEFISKKLQIIYTKNDIINGGLDKASTIGSIGFDVTTIFGLTQFQNFTVKMSCTNQQMFAFTYDSIPFQTGLLTVLNPQTYTITTGWNEIILDQPYTWDGLSNIIVEICFDNPIFTASSAVSSHFTASDQLMYKASTTRSVCGDVYGRANVPNRKPDMKFYYCDNTELQDYNFSWSPATGVADPNAISTTITPPLGTSVYTLTGVDIFGGCALVDSIVVNIGSIGTVLTGDTGICLGDSIQLSATSGASFYSWTPVSSIATATVRRPVVFPSVNTDYLLSGIGINGCPFGGAVTVSVNDKNTSDTTQLDLCTEDQVQFTAGATQFSTYLWDDGSTSPSMTLEPPTATRWVEISNLCGIFVDSIYINELLLCDVMVEIPNAFSPNNDGSNDRWEIKYLDQYPENTCIIYNQWGNIVMSLRNYQNDWEGASVPDGTYYYVLKLEEDADPIQGHVTIIR